MERLGCGIEHVAATAILETSVQTGRVIANGKEVAAELPCSLEQFLVAHKLLPRSVVVEHNGQAVVPSEFAQLEVHAGDRLEIVRIVAGG